MRARVEIGERGREVADPTVDTKSRVQRIWRAHGLAPHRVRRFKLSNDPDFVPRLREVVGLYVDPPAHAVVLSVDEKSQIQALDRTQPGLPMKKGRAGTMTCAAAGKRQTLVTTAIAREMAAFLWAIGHAVEPRSA